jgi:hypothetical protein
MGWSGKATPDGLGGYNVSVSPNSASSSGGGCFAVIIAAIALIVIGGLVVEAIKNSSRESAIKDALASPTTTQQEGISFQGSGKAWPNECVNCYGNYTYHREMQISLKNTGSAVHTVIVCAPQVSTEGMPASGPDCLSFSVAAGTTLSKTVTSDRRVAILASLDNFKVISNAVVEAIDNHPLSDAPFSLTYTNTDYQLAVCQNNGGCSVPPPG